jgi:hypothetical protein
MPANPWLASSGTGIGPPRARAPQAIWAVRSTRAVTCRARSGRGATATTPWLAINAAARPLQRLHRVVANVRRAGGGVVGAADLPAAVHGELVDAGRDGLVRDVYALGSTPRCGGCEPLVSAVRRRGYAPTRKPMSHNRFDPDRAWCRHITKREWYPGRSRFHVMIRAGLMRMMSASSPSVNGARRWASSAAPRISIPRSVSPCGPTGSET